VRSENNSDLPGPENKRWRHGLEYGRQPWREGVRRLSDLQPGESAVIAHIRCRGRLGERLAEMGLTRGTVVEVLRQAPFGGPIEVRVRGYLLSLRRCEAENIFVESGSVKNN
jgi:Fe2+ transport system protein FeoA